MQPSFIRNTLPDGALYFLAKEQHGKPPHLSSVVKKRKPFLLTYIKKINQGMIK